MYLINVTSRKIKKIKKFLQLKGMEFEETKMDDYLLTRDNPKDTIPSFLLSGAKIMEAKKDYFRIIKNYGALAVLFEKKKPPEVGQLVRIIGGEYKDLDLKGIVKDVGKKTCGVETMVWGNLVKLKAGFDDVEIVKKVSDF